MPYCEICTKMVHFQYATEDGFVFDSRECYQKYVNKKTAERVYNSLKAEEISIVVGEKPDDK